MLLTIFDLTNIHFHLFVYMYFFPCTIWKMLAFQYDIVTLCLWPVLVKMFTFLVSKCLHSINVFFFGLILGHTCVDSVWTLNKYVDSFTGSSIPFNYEIRCPNVSEYYNHSRGCGAMLYGRQLIRPLSWSWRELFLHNVCSYPLNCTASLPSRQ